MVTMCRGYIEIRLINSSLSTSLKLRTRIAGIGSDEPQSLPHKLKESLSAEELSVYLYRMD